MPRVSGEDRALQGAKRESGAAWLQNGSIRDNPGANLLKLECLPSLPIHAVDAKFFICNLGSDSQAGRRGFESHLPLHFSNI